MRQIGMMVLGLCLGWLVWFAPGGGVNGSADTGVLDFMRTQGERRYSRVPREVLAFYYTWYGRPERHGRWVHWGKVDPERHDISESTHYPARGAYDSHDPALIDAHIDSAKAHGLTGFIATWWGQGSFEDRALMTLLQRAEQKNFKVTVYWETARGKGQAQADGAVKDLAYLLKRYGASQAFLKVDGKPVIFAYGRVMDEVPLNAWPDIVTRARAAAGDFLLVADGYRPDFARLFDGIHTYNICGWVKSKNPAELRAAAGQSFAAAVRLARTQARLSCLTIIPGYDDTKIRKPGLKAERQAGQTYRVLWEEALKADPDWVLITSWNEWHEGSEIEPSREDGDQYLKLTGEYAARFKASPFSKVPVPASASSLDPARAQKLRALYAGRTIGLLPDPGGDTPFWLLDAGLKLKEMTWADLLDPAMFNARNFPLMLHAGGEHYRRTVKTEQDVERALQRYLAGGGFLVVIPHQPFPFFHDEAAGKPAVIAGSLGLPITGGWEKPPAGAALTFRLDTAALPGVPATALFPSTGDLRWRPAQRTQAAKADLYVPLAQLKDADGKSYGDGIVYVESRTPPLQGGKGLYVWMRVPEVVGVDDCLFAVFQFAAGKLSGAR